VLAPNGELPEVVPALAPKRLGTAVAVVFVEDPNKLAPPPAAGWPNGLDDPVFAPNSPPPVVVVFLFVFPNRLPPVVDEPNMLGVPDCVVGGFDMIAI